jgi:DNA-binding beta-propeller fold protein YncE
MRNMRWPCTTAMAGILVAGCASGSNGHSTAMPIIPMSARSAIQARAKAMVPYIFVSDFANNVIDVFSDTTTPLLVEKITNGVNAPEQITFDQNQTLYVTNVFAGTVTEYQPGRTDPSITLRHDLVRPSGVAVARDGTVFVSNDTEKAAVVAFKPGQMRPFEKIQRIHYALGLALDKGGDLFVAASKGVYEVPQGSSKPKKLAFKGVVSAFGGCGRSE